MSYLVPINYPRRVIRYGPFASRREAQRFIRHHSSGLALNLALYEIEEVR